MKSIVRAQVREDRIFWMTAQELTKQTNLDRKFLEKARKYQYFDFEATEDGSFRYDLKSVNEFLEEYNKLKTA